MQRVARASHDWTVVEPLRRRELLPGRMAGDLCCDRLWHAPTGTIHGWCRHRHAGRSSRGD
ncbi:hypothetical protein ACFQY9_27665 [Microvirga aerilata]|uniref:hypothetical protein n=1 Tax=Microvirga aerilata TaxID=670292 RepID=UPI00362D0B62